MTAEHTPRSIKPDLAHQEQSPDATAPAQTPIPESSYPIYVGFWERLAATLLDSLLLICITVPLTLYVYGIDPIMTGNTLIKGPLDLLINYLLPIVLVILFWRYKSATPGKMALRAIIVDADTLQKPSSASLIIRYLGYIPSTLLFGLGYIWVAFDPRKQSWHDKLAGTLVIRAPKD
ncbi:RDD family protein [Shewanella chilikensis]|uniref:RDD family protein n=1 Tax=Shewanella chilikensis TaxID=558541 RepID=UPI001F3FB5C2|nr:RDD family protein [Shewanella chilikensis]MCE9789790.1 RDD family protein [Shewanella chilikensis]